MFALAIWDAPCRELFLARDPFGKKPLYYAALPGGLAFGSEPKAVLAHPAVARRLDPEAVAHYLTLQHVPEPSSGFVGVASLPAGHTLLWRGGRPHIERFFRLEYQPKLTGSVNDLAAELRSRVTEAVRLRLVADVPLGAHLSGGVDSAIVTAVMAGLTDQPVRTFSIGFAEEAFSETPKARAVAERYATRHTEFVVGFDEARAAMEAVVAATDMPFADPSALASWHLCRLTRQHVTVALNGDGGDEMFAGYQRYWLDPLADAYARLPHVVTRRLVPWLAGLLPAKGDVPVEADWRAGIKRLAQATAIPRAASLVRWGSYFSPADRLALLRPEFAKAAGPADSVALYVYTAAASKADAPLDASLFADANIYLPGDLLVKADRMAMASGLEGRFAAARQRTGRLRRPFAHAPEAQGPDRQIPPAPGLRRPAAAGHRQPVQTRLRPARSRLVPGAAQGLRPRPAHRRQGLPGNRPPRSGGGAAGRPHRRPGRPRQTPLRPGHAGTVAAPVFLAK